MLRISTSVKTFLAFVFMLMPGRKTVLELGDGISEKSLCKAVHNTAVHSEEYVLAETVPRDCVPDSTFLDAQAKSGWLLQSR